MLIITPTLSPTLSLSLSLSLTLSLIPYHLSHAIHTPNAILANVVYVNVIIVNVNVIHLEFSCTYANRIQVMSFSHLEGYKYKYFEMKLDIVFATRL